MKTSDFDYDLPDELIAQKPAETRDSSRLMVCDRETGANADDVFSNLTQILRPNDLLLLNDTKVYPARLLGELAGGGSAEIMLVRQIDSRKYRALVRPGKKINLNTRITFPNSELVAEVISVLEGGERVVELFGVEDVKAAIDAVGQAPLPPYIRRPDGLNEDDSERYQTVFAKRRGAVAAPTAGLHFTKQLLNELKEMGVSVEYVTLHVSYGTFKPVTTEDIEDFDIEREDYSVSRSTARAINEAKLTDRRVVAVGTTAVRAIESAAKTFGIVNTKSDTTELFILPGYKFKIVDALITNFHLPKSTLLGLVSAFAGYDNVMKWYDSAIKEKYRFYSYGDAMFIE